MRDPERLNDIYNEIERLHKEYCPDWRIGQLMINFLSWLGCDPFYYEDKRLLEKIKEFFEETFQK